MATDWQLLTDGCYSKVVVKTSLTVFLTFQSSKLTSSLHAFFSLLTSQSPSFQCIVRNKDAHKGGGQGVGNWGTACTLYFL